MHFSKGSRSFTEVEKAVLVYLKSLSFPWKIVAMSFENLFPDAPKDKIMYYPNILSRVQAKEKSEGQKSFRSADGTWCREVMEDYIWRKLNALPIDKPEKVFEAIEREVSRMAFLQSTMRVALKTDGGGSRLLKRKRKDAEDVCNSSNDDGNTMIQQETSCLRFSEPRSSMMASKKAAGVVEYSKRGGRDSKTKSEHDVSPARCPVVRIFRGLGTSINKTAVYTQDNVGYVSGMTIKGATRPYESQRSLATQIRSFTMRDGHNNPIPRDPSGRDAYGLEKPGDNNPIPRDPSGRDAYGLEKPGDNVRESEGIWGKRRKIETQKTTIARC